MQSLCRSTRRGNSPPQLITQHMLCTQSLVKGLTKCIWSKERGQKTSKVLEKNDSTQHYKYDRRQPNYTRGQLQVTVPNTPVNQTVMLQVLCDS